MKKLHISIISLFAIALLACICTSCIYASENADTLTAGDADFTITPHIISKDDSAGKVLVNFNYEINPHGKDITRNKIIIHEIERRPGGESYKWIGEEKIDPNMNSGSFIREFDSNKAYAFKLEYNWDNIAWETYDSEFDF